jgi:hypothetical protein
VGTVLTALPSGERVILDMFKTRLVCAVGEKHRFLETVITLTAGGVEFQTTGKTIIHTALLKYGRVSVKGLYSEKTGKEYGAMVIMEDTGDRFVNFKLLFDAVESKGI